MQSENRIVDDIVKFVNGMAGTVAGMGREAEAGFKERTRQFVGGMDFVSREEFDAVKAMAAKAREEVETLKARLDALEGKDPSPKQSAPVQGGPAAPDGPHKAPPKKEGPGAL
ncbi:accessory factor UbiK family protein [Novosphingopyxis iocasae]|uniref:accessory factor UbiK family protein n=1 Tax=Novosphingopyxis iocasae TaxID=2762729 RepID=UPI00165167CD|nr:accessory factor UbiK family protein [Novosphingopyxis iocasae]